MLTIEELVESRNQVGLLTAELCSLLDALYEIQTAVEPVAQSLLSLKLECRAVQRSVAKLKPLPQP